MMEIQKEDAEVSDKDSVKKFPTESQTGKNNHRVDITLK
jgi:hypothetical protein